MLQSYCLVSTIADSSHILVIIWSFSAVVRAKQQEAVHGREDIRIIGNSMGGKSYPQWQQEGDGGGEQGKLEVRNGVLDCLPTLQLLRRFKKPFLSSEAYGLREITSHASTTRQVSLV